MIKVLAVSSAFPPWLAPRSVQVQRILNALAGTYRVAVVCRNVTNVEVALDSRLSQLTLNTIMTTRIAAPDPVGIIGRRLSRRLARLPDETNLWALKTFFTIRNTINQYDCLITFSTPVSDHLVGLLCKIKNRIPWIAFFSDPFTTNPYVRFSPFEAKVNRWIERSVVKHADALIFVNDYTRKSVIEAVQSKRTDKCHVIPHAFNEALFSGVGKTGEKVIMRYLGDFYGVRTPESLFKAVNRAMKARPNVKTDLKIEIYGAAQGVEEWIRNEGVGEVVQYKGQVEYLESLRLMETADVLLVVDAPGKEGLFLTSKLIDYIGARRPILAITPLIGPTADLMQEIGGNAFDPSDIEGIAGCITRYVDQKETGSLSFDVPERVYSRYRVQTVAGQYRDLIEKVRRVGSA